MPNGDEILKILINSVKDWIHYLINIAVQMFVTSYFFVDL